MCAEEGGRKSEGSQPTQGTPNESKNANQAMEYGKFPGSQEADREAVSPAWVAVFWQRSNSDTG